MQIRLKDGRFIGYADYGDPGGKPVFYFPGTPSSRLVHPPEAPTKALRVRLIVLERPGYGLSDFQKDRSLLDWPIDVLECAESLGIEQFPVAGGSGGGPYAAACAFCLPERVTRAAIIGGVGPTDLPGALHEMPRIRRMGAAVARKTPGLLAALLWLVANPVRDPESFFRRMRSGSSPVDRAAVERPEIKAMLFAGWQEAARGGLRGFAQDSIVLSNPWGFRLEDIQVPVDLWHGEQDRSVSLSAAKWMAGAIPSCTAHFLPGLGHWLALECWEEILRALLA